MVKTRTEEPVRSGWREIGGILTGTLGLLLLLGVFSYDPADISLFNNQPASHNWIGRFGAYSASRLFIYFGVAGYVIPFGILWIGVSTVLQSMRKIYPRFLWFLLALFCLSGLLDMQQVWFSLVERLNIGSPGGLMGEVLAQRSLGDWIGHAGAGIVFVVLFFIAVIRMLDLHIIDPAKKLWKWAKAFKMEAPAPEQIVAPVKRKSTRKRASKPKAEPKVQEDVNIQEMVAIQQAKGKTKPSKLVVEKKDLGKPKSKKAASPKPDATKEFAEIDNESHADYRLPSLDLLDSAVPQGKGMSPNQIADTAQILQDTLEEFGVEAAVTGVQQGPVVTCYEIKPAPGVRVERIKSLADNLALKMHAESIRIQAPIPGKGVCGVEIPNPTRQSVFFRELIEDSNFYSDEYELPLVLGKDVSGDLLVSDLTKMPHMLIAGATGAGKSVCMNSILAGLLMRCTPDQLRLILVDPKTVEFRDYSNLPHLVVPVITNAKKVALGLRWAIDEMERRFKWFNQVGVRDLPGFNARVVEKQTDMFGGEAAAGQEEEKKDTIPEKLPYIVIVVDELADLMHVAQAEIEAGIARLAAKSRAAGIHMILATQRPDVKVITGTIKANFPVRIAFKVTAKVDSRTILDRMGADTLLGKGDLLFLPPGTDKLIRSQGVFTSDSEIKQITSFCKEQGKPEFITEIHEKMEKKDVEVPGMDNGEDDEILEQAIAVIRQTKRASTSSLQRRLRIGYTRAARVMDLLEERGLIGPPDGAGPREILIDLDGEIPQNPGVENDATDKS